MGDFIETVVILVAVFLVGMVVAGVLFVPGAEQGMLHRVCGLDCTASCALPDESWWVCIDGDWTEVDRAK